MKLRILTQNMWGVPFASFQQDRTAHLCTQLNEYDIILLQEIWSQAMQTAIVAACKSLKFDYHIFWGGIAGMGIMIVSRFPIKSSFIVPYLANGKAYRIQHADFYAGKGVAMCEIMVDHKCVKVYTTHTHACYEKVHGRLVHPKFEEYAAVRLSQMIQLANTVVSTSRKGDVVVVGGDLNCTPESVAYRTFVAMTGVHPVCRGYTYTKENYFNAMPGGYYNVFGLEEDLPAQLDHLVFRGPLRLMHGEIVYRSNEEVSIKNGTTGGCPLSDHYGICGTFEVLEGMHDHDEVDSHPPMVFARNLRTTHPELYDDAQSTLQHGVADILYLQKKLLFLCCATILGGLLASHLLLLVALLFGILYVASRSEHRALQHSLHILE